MNTITQNAMATAKDDNDPDLIRGLGMWAATAVVVGSMIGQSVFLVASDMSREVSSPAMVLSVWIVGGIVVLFAAFCCAELGAFMPEAGGDYVYLTRGIGPTWGFLYGWANSIVMRPAAQAMIAAGMLRFLSFVFPPVSTPLFTWDLTLPFQSHPYSFTFTAAQPIAAVVIVVVAALNYLGVRAVGNFQVFLTSLKVAAVLAILGLGFMYDGHIGGGPAFVQLSGGDLAGFLTALVPVMAAYNGFQMLGSVGGEVRNPGKTLPRAAILGTSAVVVLYLLINSVYFRVLGFSQVAQSQHVASDAVARLIGGVGAKWFTLAMIVSAFGSLHAAFLTGPRVPFAMARDGNFFRFAKRIHLKFHSPGNAVVFQGCLSILLVLTGTHQELYSYAVFAIWVFFALTAAALIRLRFTEPEMTRPYRVWGYPWTPGVVAVAAFAISVNLWLQRPVRSPIGLAIILLGLPFLNYWRKRNVSRVGVPEDGLCTNF